MRHIIVARYQEDVSWVKRLPGGWKVRVVEKDVDVPNVGREATSYLFGLLELYDRLTERDLVACVQGDPFAHCRDLFEQLKPGRKIRGFTPLGWWRPTTDGTGLPDHPGLPVAEGYERIIGEPWPGHLTFTAGAQFVITGRDVHNIEKQTYQSLMQEAELSAGPWVLERLWEPLFTRRSG